MRSSGIPIHTYCYILIIDSQINIGYIGYILNFQIHKMLISTITDLIPGEEYVLIDNKNEIVVCTFQKIVDDHLYFYTDHGKQIYSFLPESTYDYVDSTPVSNQSSGCYCIYEPADYIIDEVKFYYSKILKNAGSVSALLGHVFTKVYETQDSIVFENDKLTVTLAHNRECCEHVWLEDVNGNTSDLENSPILRAEEKYGKSEDTSWYFYTIATRKGYLDLRFCAEYPSMYSTNATLNWSFNK
jgi:hypothetical protein